MDHKDVLLRFYKSPDLVIKRVCIEIAGSFLAGVVLDQVLRYHAEGDKIRVDKYERPWLPIDWEQWLDDICLKGDELQENLSLLASKGLLICKTFPRDGVNTIHVAVNWEHLLDQFSGENLDVELDGSMRNFVDQAMPSASIREKNSALETLNRRSGQSTPADSLKTIGDIELPPQLAKEIEHRKKAS